MSKFDKQDIKELSFDKLDDLSREPTPEIEGVGLDGLALDEGCFMNLLYLRDEKGFESVEETLEYVVSQYFK